MKRHVYLIASLLLISVSSLMAQINYEGSGIGQGIRFKTNDDSFYLKFRTRIQTRWDFESTPELDLLTNRAYVKRSRLKFDGYFINKDLRYKIEYDVVEGYVRDALIKYKMGSVDLWFGQGKLPGNRSRVISSGDLQLVDRSIYNSGYNLDRDIGFQLHHSFYIGDVFIRDIYAITSGNGILDNKKFSEGLSFTGKLEVLPFGKFTKKGDYIFSDLYREETPKLSIAGFANINYSSHKSKGQTGSQMNADRDLVTFGFDAYFKYSGYSFLVEYGGRNIRNGSELVMDDDGKVTGSYYAGKGLNMQTSYLFKSNWEITGLYSYTTPNQIDYYEPTTDHTLGVSRYIIGHEFKLQSDITYRTHEFAEDMIIFRMQLEFQF
ncbi:MAG: hypothetical protein KAH10_05780 [Flavobacteriales bacterium]|nr:hypothetical protein [Flavobacteriales bacterium]